MTAGNKNLIFTLMLVAVVPSLQAQYYSTGQDPASVRWSQIKTGSYRVIFPENFVSQSRHLARILDLLSTHETTSLQAKVPRIPVILHTSSSRSNGITVWAPRRIELYPCPPQDIYAEEWLEQLAIHEYRHAVQTSKMNQGFTRALYYILGQQGPGAILGLMIPPWFLEGDATVMETALSNSGRGRLPSFSTPLRAQLLQKGIYSYDLATLGSYKTFTPDAYSLGYFLVAKGRVQYGYELWDHALNKAARLPFLIIPFSAGIRQKTGMWKTPFYRKMMEELLITWQEQEADSRYSPYTPVTQPAPSDYTTWNRPQFLTDSILITARWNNEGIPRLLFLDRKGKTRKLARLGPYQPGSLSVAGNIAVWTEYRSDIRWANRSYSVIRLARIGLSRKRFEPVEGDKQLTFAGRKPPYRQGFIRDLTRKSRYFSPAVSPHGHLIAAVRITEENRSFLDILSAGTGEVLRSIPAPGHGVFLQPAWSDDGTRIAVILLSPEGKSLQAVAYPEGSRTVYLTPSFREISGPLLFFRQYLLFMAGYTGIENIYAIDTINRNLFQVTSARFQATHPAISPDGSTLVYSDYEADGMMVVIREADPSRWIILDTIPDYTFELAEAMAKQEGVNVQDSVGSWQWAVGKSSVQNGHCEPSEAAVVTASAAKQQHPASEYPVTRYRKFPHLFNVHSWAPAAVNVNNLTLHPGVSVLSQNVLSTLFATAGYDYDLQERTGKFYLDFSYQGWFPVIDLQYSYGKRAGTGRYSGSGETFRYTWNESNLQTTVSAPLNLSRGIWFRGIQPQVGSSWIYVIHDKTTPGNFTEGSVNTLDYRLYMYNYIRSNYQDMFPKWGQNLDIRFRHTPFAGNDLGSVFGVSSSLYFPGILRHHGIRVYGGYQRRWDNLVYGYQFSNLVALPRGTNAIYPKELVSLSANYKFPFLRLDASLGSVLYIKRFKLNLFYDWAHGWGPWFNRWDESLGFELTSELHILRFMAPFELGIQGAYLPRDNRWAWGFLWGVSL